MKKIWFIPLLLFCVTVFGQAKKPILTVLPSDNWCEQRYFMTEFDNQGIKQKVPNYKQAFQEDTELGQVIAKINSILIDKGFPPKSAEQELKNIETRNAEENMTQSKTSGSAIAETPLDRLRKRVKMDIIVQIWWKTNKDRSVSFTLEAFDAYTSKTIASQPGTSKPSSGITAVQLEKSILNVIDPFLNQLQAHFDDLLTNGREVIVTLKRWENWEHDFETEIDGDELTDHINRWFLQNTVNKRFSRTEASENLIVFEQVRIPIYDEYNQPMDAREFARGLRKFLNTSPFNYDVKLMQRGLGEAILVVGEK